MSLGRVQSAMMLEGYKVLELGSFIAAPATAGILADWGASVIKVEAPNGDPIRWQFAPAHPGGSSPNFELDNRGKRSVVIDYRTERGKAVLRELVATADVFITNLRPGSLRRAGLDHETLQAEHPRLIYTSITGYGLEGPASDKPAFDVTAFWSQSGLAGQMWQAGVKPIPFRAGIGDHITALSAALGTVTALLHRERTGKGTLVEASLLRAGVYTGGFDLADQLRKGETLPMRPRGAPGSNVSSYFPVQGGRWICVWAHDPDQDWPKIFTVAERPDLAADARFATREARLKHGAELTAELDGAFQRLTIDEAGSRLEEAGLIWAPCLVASEVVDDPLARAAGCFVTVEGDPAGPFLAPAPPVKLSGGDGAKTAPPRVGEHTEAVLTELGYTPAQIEDARRLGAIR